MAARRLHFGDPAAELAAARRHSVVADRSDLGRLVARGPDYLDLLQRLSTGDVADLEPGRGRSTVLTTPKGRIVERLFVHQLGDAGVLSVGGPACAARVLEHFARYTFAENTGLADVTAQTFLFAAVGPRAAEVLEALGWPRPEPLGVARATLAERPLWLLGHDGFRADGFAVYGDGAEAPAVWSALVAAAADRGGRPTGDEVLEAYRILRGIPVSGRELTEERNPLEAGLADAVSFDKGCYVGQEVVARLRTYDKVARALVGLRLAADAAPPAPGADLFVDGRRVGVLTSAIALPDGTPLGLGFVKRRAIRPGLRLQVGAADGPDARLADLPFDLA